MAIKSSSEMFACKSWADTQMSELVFFIHTHQFDTCPVSEGFPFFFPNASSACTAPSKTRRLPSSGTGCSFRFRLHQELWLKNQGQVDILQALVYGHVDLQVVLMEHTALLVAEVWDHLYSLYWAPPQHLGDCVDTLTSRPFPRIIHTSASEFGLCASCSFSRYSRSTLRIQPSALSAGC